MTRKEIQTIIIKVNNILNKNVEAYNDFLDIQEGLIGEHSPLITKFRSVIHKFNNDSNKVLKAICDDLQNLYPR